MNFQELITRFINIEKELRLFDLKVNNVFIWDYLRFKIYRKLLEKTGIHGEWHTDPPHTFIDRLKILPMLIHNSIRKNPLSGAANKDVLVFSHPRRKLFDDGKYWDIYTDFLLDRLPFSAQTIEMRYEERHLVPPKNSELKYLDFLESISFLGAKLQRLKIKKEELGRIKSVGLRLEKEFGVKVDLENMVKRALLKRMQHLWSASMLLNRYKPKLILEIVYYGPFLMALNELCSAKGIPTVELQHGTLYPSHLAYDFPNLNRELTVFPKYSFLFGSYWKENVNLPVPDSRISVTGYPYFEYEFSKQAEVKKDPKQVLFISQGAIGKYLSKLANDFSREPAAAQYKIIYKLHPGEYSRWQKEYPWLERNESIKVVSDDSVSIYTLFKQSSFQVGAFSTALYEGLAFGLKTFIAKFPGYESMEKIIERGWASEIKDAKELVEKMTAGKIEAVKTDCIFEKNSVNNIITELKRICPAIFS